MRKVKLLICITTLTCIILGCQPKPDYSEQEKLIHQYFTYVKNFDVDGLKTVIYNEGSSLYDPNILYDIYDIYETMYSQIYMRFTIKNMSMNISPHKRKNL